jgi:hypothetical protein
MPAEREAAMEYKKLRRAEQTFRAMTTEPNLRLSDIPSRLKELEREAQFLKAPEKLKRADGLLKAVAPLLSIVSFVWRAKRFARRIVAKSNLPPNATRTAEDAYRRRLCCGPQ